MSDEIDFKQRIKTQNLVDKLFSEKLKKDGDPSIRRDGDVEMKDPTDKEEKVKTEYVDGHFGKEIKIKHQQKIKHRSSMIPDGPLFLLLLGQSGSGKSCNLLSIIPSLSKQIKRIGICTLIRGNKSHEAIKNYCEENDMICKISYEVDSAMDMIESLANTRDDMDDKICLIFDDFTNYSKSRDNPFNRIQTQSFSQLRNYGIECMITITQSALNVPTLIRANSNMRIIYPMSDTFAYRSTKDDIINSLGADASIPFEKAYRLIRDTPFSFILFSGNKLSIKYPNKDFEVIFDSTRKTSDTEKKYKINLFKKIRNYQTEYDESSLDELIEETNKILDEGLMEYDEILTIFKKYHIDEIL